METTKLSWFVPACAVGAKKDLDVMGRRRSRNTGGREGHMVCGSQDL